MRNRKKTMTGMVLLTSIILLVVLTVLAIAIFKSFGILQPLAGNLREKQRSLESAQAALQYGETYLAQSAGTVGSACTTVAYPYASSTGVCSDALPSPTTVPWSNSIGSLGTPVSLPGMTINTAGAAGTYYSQPGVYMTYLGGNNNPKQPVMYYQITSVGYGGNSNAISVVQENYELTSPNINAGEH